MPTLRVGAALPDPPFELLTQQGPAGFDIALVHFDDHPGKVKRWRARGLPFGPFWRWTAQEITIECVQR